MNRSFQDINFEHKQLKLIYTFFIFFIFGIWPRMLMSQSVPEYLCVHPTLESLCDNNVKKN